MSPVLVRTEAAPGPLRRAASATTRPVRDWLGRPMASFHLIMSVFLIMLGFGLLMVLSASSISSFRSNTDAQGVPLDTVSGAFGDFTSQAVFAGLGLVAFVATMRMSPRVMRTFSWSAVMICLVLLAGVLVVGKMTNGARSWYRFGPINFQPSELAKLVLLVWMAHVLAARRHQLRSLRALLWPVTPLFLIMVALIMRQPDLGTTITLSVVYFAVLWFAGAPLWLFLTLAVLGGGGALTLAKLAKYRDDRITAWLHPDLANAYQLYQGYFGMGHGGLFGAGLGQSLAKWGALPNADSDFIFAVVGEELGLVGTGLILLMNALLAYTGLRIAQRNVDPFIKISAAACTVWLVGQAAINIGYVVGLLPVTGIPLPMISRGGTSLLVTMVVFGLLANFARREPQAAAALYAQGPGRIGRFLGLTAKPPGDSMSPKKLARVQARRERKRVRRVQQAAAQELAVARRAEQAQMAARARRARAVTSTPIDGRPRSGPPVRTGQRPAAPGRATPHSGPSRSTPAGRPKSRSAPETVWSPVRRRSSDRAGSAEAGSVAPVPRRAAPVDGYPSDRRQVDRHPVDHPGDRRPGRAIRP